MFFSSQQGDPQVTFDQQGITSVDWHGYPIQSIFSASWFSPLSVS